MSEPRRRRMADSGSANRSVGVSLRVAPASLKRMRPEMLAEGGNSRNNASEVADLPEPDSPTRPSVSPAAI